jgi:tetratricopeptide (TPR) repeat protein
LLTLVPLQDSRPINAQSEYERARNLFLHGKLEESQRQAENGYVRFAAYDPAWASRFRLLDAESMLYRGLYSDTLSLLRDFHPASQEPGQTILQLTLEGVSLAHLHQMAAAKTKLAQAEVLCQSHNPAACGEVFRARGILASESGLLKDARESFLQSLTNARTYHDRWLETSALTNLGFVSLAENHYDEALEWSRDAYQSAVNLGAENLAQVALGNLGWAYFELGDSERALPLFNQAERLAVKLGNIRNEVKWLTTTGYVYQNSGDWMRASQFYGQVLDLARPIHSQEDIINSLEDLAHLSIAMGDLDKASGYIAQLTPMVRATNNHLDSLDVTLAQGEIAAARHQDQQAEALFKTVDADPNSQTSMRLGSEHQLATLYEREGNTADADRMYRTARPASKSKKRTPSCPSWPTPRRSTPAISDSSSSKAKCRRRSMSPTMAVRARWSRAWASSLTKSLSSRLRSIPLPSRAKLTPRFSFTGWAIRSLTSGLSPPLRPSSFRCPHGARLRLLSSATAVRCLALTAHYRTHRQMARLSTTCLLLQQPRSSRPAPTLWYSATVLSAN